MAPSPRLSYASCMAPAINHVWFLLITFIMLAHLGACGESERIPPAKLFVGIPADGNGVVLMLPGETVQVSVAAQPGVHRAAGTLKRVTLTGPDRGAFSLTTIATPIRLEPGTSTAFGVSLDPAHPADRGVEAVLEIDGALPSAHTLRYDPLLPRMVLEYQASTICTEDGGIYEEELVVSNAGGSDLTITGLLLEASRSEVTFEFEGQSFRLESGDMLDVEPPMRLRSREELVGLLRHQPTVADFLGAALYIESDDPWALNGAENAAGWLFASCP